MNWFEILIWWAPIPGVLTCELIPAFAADETAAHVTAHLCGLASLRARAATGLPAGAQG